MSAVDREHYEDESLWGTENIALPDHQRQRMAAIDALLPSVATVVDIGAGDGRVLRHLQAARGPELRVVAVERSSAALAHVPRRCRVQGSIDSLPLGGRSFDAVLCCEVLEHLPDPILRAAVSELARVADRYVLVTVPNREVRRRADIVCRACNCRYNRERHLRSFDAQSLRGLLPGFQLVSTTEAGPRQPMYPRWVRTSMERVGLLPVLGSPSCPQCGLRYRPTGDAVVRPVTPGSGRSAYTHLRRLAPKQRWPYWLLALYSRG